MADAARAEIGSIERLIALRSFPGWADLPARELGALSMTARPRLALRGQTILDAREIVSSVCLVVDGELVARRGERVLSRVGPRDWIGAVLAFAQSPTGVECVAVRDSLVLELDVDDLEDVFEDRVAVLARAVGALSRETIELRRAIPDHAGFPGASPSLERLPMRALDVVERLSYLRQSSSLRRGRIDAMTAIAESARELRAPAGERLWTAGDASGSMIAIIGGRVTATTDRQRFTFGPGDMIGSLDAFAGQPRWYEATVTAPLTALVLERDEMLDVWEDHPDLGIAVLRAVSTALLGLLDRTPG